MVSKECWKEDRKRRWTSLWTNCPPSPSGHIFSSELVWPHQVNYQVNLKQDVVLLISFLLTKPH